MNSSLFMKLKKLHLKYVVSDETFDYHDITLGLLKVLKLIATVLRQFDRMMWHKLALKSPAPPLPFTDTMLSSKAHHCTLQSYTLTGCLCTFQAKTATKPFKPDTNMHRAQLDYILMERPYIKCESLTGLKNWSPKPPAEEIRGDFLTRVKIPRKCTQIKQCVLKTH